MAPGNSRPVIRIWGGHRESDWNSYWRTSELLSRREDLAEALQSGPDSESDLEIDICPARDKTTLREFDVFVRKATSPEQTQTICKAIQDLTGRIAGPMDIAAEPGAAEEAFQAMVSQRLLYLRQRFEPWDEALPRFILGVDFDSGRHVRLRPAEPQKWRLVDHMVGGLDADRRVLPALLLDPSPKGARLLAELKTEFDNWYQHDFSGRPSLDAVMDYKRVLDRFQLSCNETFRYGLTDGWFPMDTATIRDWNAARELCSSPLPDNRGDLLLDENGETVGVYGAIFSFVALPAPD